VGLHAAGRRGSVPRMGLVTLIAAAEEGHHSETPFFILGLLLAGFAVLISVVGFTRPQFPGSDGAARGVISIGAVLVVVVGALVIWMNS
jgi:hypothetical protein